MTAPEQRTEQGGPAVPSCPRCGADETVGILYDYPSPETFDAVERGDMPGVAIGGCIVDESNPTWACPACRHAW